jgi:sulfur carrier protein ThiS adenylyltransferase
MNYLEVRERLAPFKVGIAGCGGLGSNCAVALARVGIGELVIVDFDKVEESNLNRQYFFQHQIGMDKPIALKQNIELIGSPTRVTAIVRKLDEESIAEVFSGCHVVVEAFDRADQKVMLIESLLESDTGRYIISGVGMAGWGDTELISVHKYENLIICGDMRTEAGELMSPLAPRVGIVANMQANMVMEVLLGKMKNYGNTSE